MTITTANIAFNPAASSFESQQRAQPWKQSSTNQQTQLPIDIKPTLYHTQTLGQRPFHLPTENVRLHTTQ